MTSPDDRALVTFCPFCGKKNDRHQCVNAIVTPKAGDVGICWSCTRVFVFNTATTVRRPTDEEQAKIDSDPRVVSARGIARESYTADEAVALTRQVLDADEGDAP